MDLSHRFEGRICVFYFDPEILEEAVFVQTETALESLAKDKSVEGILVNFERVTKLESRDLGLIMKTYNELSSRGANLGICSLAPKLWTLFQLARLDQFVRQYTSEEVALAAMRSSGEGVE